MDLPPRGVSVSTVRLQICSSNRAVSVGSDKHSQDVASRLHPNGLLIRHDRRGRCADTLFVAPDHAREQVLTRLRGIGIRLGELLDLELDCAWDSASQGSSLKAPSANSAPNAPSRSTHRRSPCSANG